jgi:hypothetical protein
MRRSITFNNFYKTKLNSVDMIFLGSSRAYCSFNPRVFNDKLNISSYNLGSSEQSFASSYYILRETLKYQKPKLVIQEVSYSCHNLQLRELKAGVGNFDGFNLKNTELYEKLSRTDRLKYNIKYFNLDRILNNILLNLTGNRIVENIDGFVAWKNRLSDKSVYAIIDSKRGEFKLTEQFYQNMEYFDRIIELCKKEDIKLIFVSAPQINYPLNHKEIQNYFKEFFNMRKCVYYDFTEKTGGGMINFILTNDFLDSEHLNIYGAEKISIFMSKLISENKLLPVSR